MICFSEADKEIAVLANEKNCPVISEDSDFFTFDIPAGYIPLSSIQYTEWLVRKYHRSLLAEHLDIEESLLPLLASLMGNDYVGKDVLLPFDQELERIPPTTSCNQNDWSCIKIHKVRDILVDHTAKDKAMDFVLGRIYEHRKRDELKTALEKSLDEYVTENITATSTLASKFEECVAIDNSHGNIPKYVIDRYHHGNFPVRYMGVIHSPRQILKFQVEDISKASCNNCSKRLRRFIYGILLPKNEGVLEWDREGGRLVEFTVQPVIVTSDGHRVPNLESLPGQNKYQRKDLLFSILESNESIQSLPDQEQLFAASISYWIRNARPKVSKDCVKILLLQYLQENMYRNLTNSRQESILLCCTV